MDQSNRDMHVRLSCTLSYIIKHLREIIIIMLICGIGLDVYRTVTYTPTYQAVMTVNFTNGDDNSYNRLYNTVTYITNMNYIFNSELIKKDVCDKLKVSSTSATCTVSSISDTSYAYITVTAKTKREAYIYLNYITDWYNNNKTNYSFNYSINVIDQSPINETATNSNTHSRNLILGLIAGGVLGTAIFGLYSYLSQTIKTSSEIDRKLSARLFARIPKEKKRRWGKKRGLLITSLKTSFAYKESIKKLRSKIEESSKKHGYHSIMVAGSLENEGKSSIAVNLAIALAQNNHRVLLMDADFRKPSIHLLLGIKNKGSVLNDYLDGVSSLASVIRKTNTDHLYVIVSQRNEKHADEYINSNNMKALLEEASESFDYVIIDTPPARYLTDAMQLNMYVDASLLVVKQDSATVKEINETIARLASTHDNLIGCVYNASVKNLSLEKKAYGYRYGKYGYGYGYGSKRGS